MQAFLRTAGLVVVLLLAGLTAAFADAAAQSKLASEKFDDIEAGVSALATSGDPQASAVIGALADGKLTYDPASKVLYYQKGADTFEGVGGTKVAAPLSGLKK